MDGLGGGLKLSGLMGDCRMNGTDLYVTFHLAYLLSCDQDPAR
jgi:hypothetical protein